MSWNQLAWKTKPSIAGGEPEVIRWLDGELEIPRKGFLDATEMQLIREVDPSNMMVQVLYKQSVALAAQIADEASWNSVKCYGLLCSMFGSINGSWRPTEEEAKIIVANSSLIEDCIKQVNDVQSIVRIRTITVVLMRNTPNWTDQMTKELPGHLQDQIYAFADQEARAGMGEVDLEKAQQQLADDLKKLQRDTRSILNVPTSISSSGNAEHYGPVPLNSTAKPTAPSQVPLSLKPSTKALRRRGVGFTKKR